MNVNINLICRAFESISRGCKQQTRSVRFRKNVGKIAANIQEFDANQ